MCANIIIIAYNDFSNFTNQDYHIHTSTHCNNDGVNYAYPHSVFKMQQDALIIADRMISSILVPSVRCK